MKNIIHILCMLPFVLLGQNYDTPLGKIDSAYIEYTSPCEFFRIHIKMDAKKILYYGYEDELSFSNRHKRIILYQTRNKDTISIVQDCLAVINESEIEPAVDTSGLVWEWNCIPVMAIKTFAGSQSYEKRFENVYSAIFPFAYTKLYHILLSSIDEHIKTIGKQIKKTRPHDIVPDSDSIFVYYNDNPNRTYYKYVITDSLIAIKGERHVSKRIVTINNESVVYTEVKNCSYNISRADIIDTLRHLMIYTCQDSYEMHSTNNIECKNDEINNTIVDFTVNNCNGICIWRTVIGNNCKLSGNIELIIKMLKNLQYIEL